MIGRRDMLAPWAGLWGEMDDLFNERLAEKGERATFLEGNGFFSPRIDVCENDKALKVVAELPGAEEEDVDVELSANTLILKGKKVEEKEEKGETFYRKERRAGSFYREIPLPWEIGAAKVKATATFRNGVLTVTVPKPKDVPASTRRIPVKVS
jgi:HSP20 family protein